MSDASPTFPIAYVAGQFPLRSETFVWREVRELRRRGWIVHTFGLHRPADVPAGLADLLAGTRFVYEGRGGGGGGWPVNPLNRALPDMLFPGEPTGARDRLKLPFQREAGARLGRWLRDAKVRHVHAHFAHAPATVAMYSGVPFSFTGHANDLFQRRQLLKRKLQRAAFVACISEWHRGLYESVHPGGRYEIVRCGVPLAEYAVGDPPGEAGRLRVLAVARLVAKKGLDTLVRAARGLEGVEVTIAGDGPMRGELGALAGPNVRLIGPVEAGAVPGLLREHDAFALPCRPSDDGDRDGIPVALMEAMAAARPVVAGDLPAVRELVADGGTGQLVAVEGVPLDGQAAALAAILAAWRDDPAERRRLGAAGRARVAAEFSLDANVARLEAAFRGAARGRQT